MRWVVILIRSAAEVKNLVAHGQELLYWKTRFFVASSYEAPLLLRMTSFHHDHLDSVIVLLLRGGTRAGYKREHQMDSQVLVAYASY